MFSNNVNSQFDKGGSIQYIPDEQIEELQDGQEIKEERENLSDETQVLNENNTIQTNNFIENIDRITTSTTLKKKSSINVGLPDNPKLRKYEEQYKKKIIIYIILSILIFILIFVIILYYKRKFKNNLNN